MNKKFLLFFITVFFNFHLLLNSGCFVQTPGSPYSAGDIDDDAPQNIAFTLPLSTGKLFAAIPNRRNPGAVMVYSVNKVTGVFSPIARVFDNLGNRPNALAFTPELSNNNVFVLVGDNTPSISVFSVNTTSGAFTSAGSIATTDIPRKIVITPQFMPSGNIYAAVMLSGSTSMEVFSINPNNGALISLGLTPIGDNPVDLAISQMLTSGNVFAAVPTFSPNEVVVYSVGSNGTFSQVGNSPFTLPTIPNGIAISPQLNNNKLYAAVSLLPPGPGPGIEVFDVDITNGDFNTVAGSPFPVFGDSPSQVAFTNELAPLPGQLFAMISSNGTWLNFYSVNLTDGAFTPLSFSPVELSQVAGIAFTKGLSTENVFAAAVNNDLVDVTVGLFYLAVPNLLTATSDCDANVTVVGTGAQPNNTITVFADASNIGTGSADGSGNFNFTIPTSLTNGTYSITVTQTNSTCTSLPSNSTNLTVTRSAAPPVLSSASSDCRGSILTVLGSGAQANATITVFANSVNVGNSNADGTGKFDFTLNLNPALSAGTHSIKVTQTSLGCQSSFSNSISIVVSGCEFEITSEPPISTTTNRTPTISGIGPANSRLLIIDEFQSNTIMITKATQMSFATNIIGETTSDSAGNFSFTPTTPLAPGRHTIFAALASNLEIRSNKIVIIIISNTLEDALTTAILNKYGCAL